MRLHVQVSAALRFVACLLAGLLLASARMRAGVGVWTTSGPLVPQGIHTLAIDPVDSSTVYVAFAFYPQGEPVRSQVLRGTEFGRSWTPILDAPAGTEITSIAIDPSDPMSLFAFAGTSNLINRGQLLMSRDGGSNWSVRHEFADTGDGILAFDGSSPPLLLLAATSCHCGISGCSPSDCPATIFRSLDRGIHWEEHEIGEGTSRVTGLAIHPITPGVIYAGTDAGLFRSLSGGVRWSPFARDLLPGCESVSAVAIDPIDGGTLLVSFFEHYYPWFECGGAFVSRDAGSTWELAADLPYHAHSFAFDRAHPATIYSAAGGFDSGDVYRSVDGAGSWTPLADGLDEAFVGFLAIDGTGTVLYTASRDRVFDYEVGPLRLIPPRRGRHRPARLLPPRSRD